MVAPAAAAEATPAMPAEAMLALALALAERPAEMPAEPMRQPTCSSSSLTHLLKRTAPPAPAGSETQRPLDQENETATQKAEREAAEAASRPRRRPLEPTPRHCRAEATVQAGLAGTDPTGRRRCHAASDAEAHEVEVNDLW